MKPVTLAAAAAMSLSALAANAAEPAGPRPPHQRAGVAPRYDPELRRCAAHVTAIAGEALPLVPCANLKRADLRGRDLRGLDLRGALLQWADLTGADLRGADLRGAKLFRAKLDGADLRSANLEQANLIQTSLVEANLEGASLRHTQLGRAHIARANFARADLRGAYFAPEPRANAALTTAPASLNDAQFDACTDLPFDELFAARAGMVKHEGCDGLPSSLVMRAQAATDRVAGEP